MIKYYHKIIYLLPFALITGPFLPDLIVVLCSCFFLIYCLRLRLFKYFNNNFFKIFLLFYNIKFKLFFRKFNVIKYSLVFKVWNILNFVILYFKNIKIQN